MRMMSAVVMLLAACGETKAPAGVRVTSRNECMFSGDLQKLVFQALIPIHYTKGVDEPYSRQLYQLECSLKDNECDGVLLLVDVIDRGESIGMLSFGRVIGAEVLSVTGKIITIRWGVFRTFTVDFERSLVTYAESGEGMRGPIEGRGEVKCEASWAAPVLRRRQGPGAEEAPSPEAVRGRSQGRDGAD
jgi:hypothetical protein